MNICNVCNVIFVATTTVEPVQWPPLWDDHSSKVTNAESAQVNSHTIVTV